MKRACIAGLVVLATVVAWGCATITSGTSQSLSISSNVEGAELFLDGERIGTTPYTGVVKKGKRTLRVEAEGYRPETVTLSRSLEPIFWGNIIIGGTLGSITDFASGAAYQYAPATYQVELQAVQQSAEDYLRQLAVRKFSMVYVDEISRDLAMGGGDYVQALSALLEARSGSSASVTDISEALAASAGDPVAFANELVENE